jgi:hypothetical protein
LLTERIFEEATVTVQKILTRKGSTVHTIEPTATIVNRPGIFGGSNF